MFEAAVTGNLHEAVQELADAPLELATPEQLGDLLREVAAAQALLDGVLARGLTVFAEAGGPEAEGAPSVKAWAQRDLHLGVRETGRLVTAARTTQRLPRVGQALRDGRIRLAHVHEFSAGLKKTEPEVMLALEDYLLDVAERNDPRTLKIEIRDIVEAVHPDEVDAAWMDGMDRRDIRVSQVGDYGYAVTGFLDIGTGAKLKAVVDHLAAPDDRDDTRRPSERRVANLDQLLTHVLEHGLPVRKGFRPQLRVSVDLDRLQGVPGAEPARLHGWGVLGDQMLGAMLCDADVTPVLTDSVEADDTGPDDTGPDDTGPAESGRPRVAAVLNVGRTSRLANPQQRVAVGERQGGRCANPGCANTHLELHHIDWWHRDLGPTDLDNLVGLCPRCHHLVHAGQLHAVRNPDDGTVVLSTSTGRRLTDDTDQIFTRLLARRRLRELRRRVRRAAAEEARAEERLRRERGEEERAA